VAEVAIAAPRRFAFPRLTAGLGPGVSLLYLSIMVALPVAALVSQSATGGFWAAISAPEARSALEFTVGVSVLTAAINVVTGVALAWVLVRDEFPGKRIVNSLIDLPFALPTIVAGLVLLTLYGPNSPVGVNVSLTRFAVLLALLFVTLPFVTRAVQPVLLSLERDVEDAAACLGATPFTTSGHPACGDHRRLAGLRSGARGVRRSPVDLGQPAVPHRGLLGLHLRSGRER
jgi:sulfate transport system permease protein